MTVVEKSDDTGVVRLQISATLRVDEDEFARFVTALTDGVRSEEPGAVRYGWHFDAATQACLIEEEYADRHAFESHMHRFRQSGQMKELAGLLRIERIVVLAGDPSSVKAQMRGLDPIFYRTIATL
jgi:quinol monooxygenase YgiN